MKNTIAVFNVLLGALFAFVAAGPIVELTAYRPAFGVQSTVEAAALFSAVAAAFFFGAWVLIRAWPKMWAWQLVPASAGAGIALLFVS